MTGALLATMRSHDGSPIGNHEPKQPKQGEGAGQGRGLGQVCDGRVVVFEAALRQCPFSTG
jgi:hypothetical protein